METLSQFTKQYSVDKTLRFELKPIGATAEKIKDSKILNGDFERANAYEDVKKIIDDYHKRFIDESLSEAPHIDWKQLQDAIIASIRGKDWNTQKRLSEVQDSYRKDVMKVFKNSKNFDLINGGGIFELLLRDCAGDSHAEERNLLKKFESFPAYFAGFFEYRKTIYSDEKITTAIPYRIVHDNFPKFSKNVRAYNRIRNKIPGIIPIAARELSLDHETVGQTFSVNSYNKLLTQKGIDEFNAIITGVPAKEGVKKRSGFNEIVSNYLKFHAVEGIKPEELEMQPLTNQILCDRELPSSIPKSIENDEDLLKCIADFYKNELCNFEMGGKQKNVLKALAPYCQNPDRKKVDEIEELFRKFSKIGTSGKELREDSIKTETIKQFLDSILEYKDAFKKYNRYNKSNSVLKPCGESKLLLEQLGRVAPLYSKVRTYFSQKLVDSGKIKLNLDFPALGSNWEERNESVNGAVILKRSGKYFLGIMNRERMPKFEECGNIAAEYYEKMIYGSLGSEGDVRQARQNYTISFIKIAASDIDSMVEDGALFLFQIYNKDFAEKATGRKNLHTLYWENLFSEDNLRNVVLKLNGGAELFFREKKISKPYVHFKGEKMINRYFDADGERVFINERAHKRLVDFENGKIAKDKLSSEAKKLVGKYTVKTARFDIVKDRRYTEDKFLFHVPITINFGAGDKKMNKEVLGFLKNTSDVKIIGLDCGEKHLLYLSLIDETGKILEQRTLNGVNVEKEIDGKNTSICVDYHSKLEQREKERDSARKSWNSVARIKDLKEGYLSLVVHEIATMMIEKNAIVVLEDLNFGFKRGSFKMEKLIYQKFEKMLIDKLNYLTFKDRPNLSAGGILNGYQLTEKFESFEKLGGQSGFLFYVPAEYTSQTDPETGFVDLFIFSGITNMGKKKEFFSRFDKIYYDADTDSFCFEFNYSKFRTKVESHKKWSVYSHGMRIEHSETGVSYVEPTKEIKRVLASACIDCPNGENIIPEIRNSCDFKLFDTLFHCFGLTLKMRNSNAATGEDYVLSPVKNSSGKFYDSRNCDETLPKDGDANGAYHIALKGLMLLEKIRASSGRYDTRLENRDYIEFVQKRARKR